jgi:hypothetical protein
MTDDLGSRLYRIVEEYCAIGEHRTGLPEDAATVAWFADALRAMGGKVEEQPYTFQRYDAHWRVTVDGEPVTALPLFYEGTGSVRTDAPFTATIPVLGGSYVPAFEPLARQALAAGKPAAVIATTFGDGQRLQGVNRHIRPGSGLPTICVAGALGGRLAEGHVHLELDAQLVTGRSANVLALFGEAPFEQRVLLTTPLSGWFRAAGERGCGIALCLEVARALAPHAPIAVLGTNSHELMGYGLRAYLQAGPPAPAAIFHFGANVAVHGPGGAGADPLPALTVRGWLPAEQRPKLAETFAHISHPVEVVPDGDARQPQRWRGEARHWCTVGVPLISMVGSSSLHHTPEDVPELATSPSLLAAACEGAVRAARLLVASIRC